MNEEDSGSEVEDDVERKRIDPDHDDEHVNSNHSHDNSPQSVVGQINQIYHAMPISDSEDESEDNMLLALIADNQKKKS